MSITWMFLSPVGGIPRSPVVASQSSGRMEGFSQQTEELGKAGPGQEPAVQGAPPHLSVPLLVCPRPAEHTISQWPTPCGHHPCCQLQDFSSLGTAPAACGLGDAAAGSPGCPALERAGRHQAHPLPPESPLCWDTPSHLKEPLLAGRPMQEQEEQASLGTQTPQACRPLRMGSAGHLPELLQLLNELRFPKHLEQCGTGVRTLSIFLK